MIDSMTDGILCFKTLRFWLAEAFHPIAGPQVWFAGPYFTRGLGP